MLRANSCAPYKHFQAFWLRNFLHTIYIISAWRIVILFSLVKHIPVARLWETGCKKQHNSPINKRLFSSYTRTYCRWRIEFIVTFRIVEKGTKQARVNFENNVLLVKHWKWNVSLVYRPEIRREVSIYIYLRFEWNVAFSILEIPFLYVCNLKKKNALNFSGSQLQLFNKCTWTGIFQ